MLSTSARSFVSWLAPIKEISAIDDSELEAFSRSLVFGLGVLERARNPLFLESVLGKEGYLCAFCVACLWDGLTDPILAQTEFVPEALSSLWRSIVSVVESGGVPTREDDIRCGLLLELVAYRGRAFARLGRHDECESEWKILDAAEFGFVFGPMSNAVPWTRRAYRIANAKARIERGVVALNKGHFRKSLEWAEPALDGDSLSDVAAELRGLGVCQLAAIGLGEQAKLKRLFNRELRILNSEPEGFGGFKSARARREITALLAQEAFDEGELALDVALSEIAGRDDLLEALLRQLKLRLFLVRNDCSAAEKELSELEAFAQPRAFPAATFDLSTERYELALRQRKQEKLGEQLHNGLAEALIRDDVLARMSASLFLSRWQLMSGLHEKARESIQLALRICENEAYGVDRVDCLFHAMGVAHATRDVKFFRECAQQAGKLARKLGLLTRAACFEYILSLTSPARSSSALPLLELLRAPRVGRDAFYFIEYYGFFKGMRFEVRGADSHNEPLLLDERALRRDILDSEGTWWFEDAGVLLAVHGKQLSSAQITTVELPKGSLLRQGFEALLCSSEGLSTQNVHALTSEASYHPLRHASKVKTLVHRLRAVVEQAGLTLRSVREGGRYVLEGKDVLFCVRGPISRGDTLLSDPSSTHEGQCG